MANGVNVEQKNLVQVGRRIERADADAEIRAWNEEARRYRASEPLICGGGTYTALTELKPLWDL